MRCINLLLSPNATYKKNEYCKIGNREFTPLTSKPCIKRTINFALAINKTT